MTARPLPGHPRGPLIHDGWLAWIGRYHDVVLATVVLLPVAILGVGAMARLRQRAGASPARAWRLSLAEVGMVYLTLPAVWITVLPGAHAGEVPGRVSLVPLRDLATMDSFQVTGNLLLLSALGFLAPVRFVTAASWPRVVALAASCSALIETAQYVLRLDRVSSVDDVLLNTAGAGLAALASRPWWRMRSTCTPRVAPWSRSAPSPSWTDRR